jgi:SAM-dependent methyltransferase
MRPAQTGDVAVAHGVSNYDDFALIYNRHWGPRYAASALETLESLVLSRIPTGGSVLDLCCGAGQISRILTDRGFNVLGLDASASLVGLARKNAPNAHFEVADAKFFGSTERFQAAISLNDSLNHLLSIEDLKSAFLNVYKCMVPGGVFLFDLNLAHKYESSWAGSFSIVEEDAVCAVVATRDTQQRLARFDAAVFLLTEGLWTRKDVRLLQTWYLPGDVCAALVEVGFADVRLTDRKGAQLTDCSIDKAFFTCTRN